MASNEKELSEVLSPLTKKEVAKIDKLNYVDFGFMIAYGFFIWLFMTLFNREIESNIMDKCRWLVLVVIIADILENIQLLKLSHFFENGLNNISSALYLLAIFTWLKWLLLAFLFLVIGNTFMKLSIPSKLTGSVLVIPFTLGLLAFFTKRPLHEDIFATSIFGCFFIITLYSMLYKKIFELKVPEKI